MVTGDDILNNSKHVIKEKDTVVFSTGWEKRIKEKGNIISVIIQV
jgi:hypothetical protein